MKTKICSKCKRELEINQFTKATKSSDGLMWWCKKCSKETHKIYWENNKKLIEKQQIKYRKNRRHNDINYKVLKNLRNRLWKVLNENTKFKSTINLLGCSIEQLREHLQKQFRPGMTWDNYGQWHIDHIRPCASFDLSKKSE
jgi:hypothetical protein